MRIIVFVLAVLFAVSAAAQTSQGTVKSVNKSGTHAMIVGADGFVYQVNLVTERKGGTNVTRIVPGAPVVFTAGNGRTASNLEVLEACAGNTCGAGEFCCNASCGICAPIGGGCIQIFCGGLTP